MLFFFMNVHRFLWQVSEYEVGYVSTTSTTVSSGFEEGLEEWFDGQRAAGNGQLATDGNGQREP